MPGGLNGPALKQGLITAAPMFSAMAAGYASGRGPYAYMDQGAQLIQQQLKAKRDEEAAAAASRAFSGLVPGGMGKATMGPSPRRVAAPPRDPNSPDAIASDAMFALGKINPDDREILAKTLMAEAGGEGYGGMLAAGAVIDNRRKAGGYGDGWRGVIMKPGQFSAWNSATGYAGGEGGLDMASITPSADAYAAADAILTANYADPTGGATHYYNPAVADPKWGQQAGGDWTTIGNHVFGFADAGRAGPPDPMQDPYVQQLMQVMAMPGLTPEQQAVVQLQLKSRVDLLSKPQPGAEEEAARAMRARDADLLGYQRGSPEWTQYVVTGEMAKPASPTDDMREYEFAKSQGYQGTFQQYQIDMKKAGASSTTVSVGDGMPGLGKLSPDYAYVMDPQGNPVIDPTTGLPKSAPVPGSPADQEAKAAAAKAEMRNEAAMRTAKIVTDKIQEARDILDKSSALNPATGFGAETASGYGGTNAADMKATVDTITSSIAFDRLQSMREASPTGGALGAVSDTEMRLLSAAIASLSQTQSPEQFAKHLDDVERIYGEVMKKFAAYPDAGGAAPVTAPDLGLSEDDMKYLGQP